MFQNIFATTCAFIALSASAHAETIPCPLDSLLEAPANWQMTPEEFAKKFTNGESALFVWLTKGHTRAKIGRRLYGNTTIDLSLFGGEDPFGQAAPQGRMWKGRSPRR